MTPKILMIAGANGAGKTTLATRLLLDQWTENALYINPDNIAKEKFGDWNSKEAIIKAAQLAMEMRETCLQEGQSLVFETVFSALDKIDFLKRAKESGYFIRMFFVGTDSPELNKERVAQRVRLGGHTVPEDKIVSRYYKSLANCVQIASWIDKLYVFDNSQDFFTNPNAKIELLFRATAGKLEKQYKTDLNAWAKPIFEALEK